MAVKIKSEKQIEKMREVGKIVALAHAVLRSHIKPGITTKELDTIAEKEILKYDAIPAFKGYGGFPASICTSVNDQVVHGIPGPYSLKDGDIISIDIGALKDNFFGDSAKTYHVGSISDDFENMLAMCAPSSCHHLVMCR